ncbi:uncharacterized protein ACWYII_031743 isoform 1-T1 [Salvelinus alpinus]
MDFHTQIASIMELLANSALAEICKFVDDNYAVFSLEITQSQKENRGLWRKLQILELVARERVLTSRPTRSSTDTEEWQESADCRSWGQAGEDLRHNRDIQTRAAAGVMPPVAMEDLPTFTMPQTRTQRNISDVSGTPNTVLMSETIFPQNIYRYFSRARGRLIPVGIVMH